MENTNDMIPIIHATYLNGGYVILGTESATEER